MASPFTNQTGGSTNAKPIPHTAGPSAHTNIADEGDPHLPSHTDLYRTFSPTDIAFFDWRSQPKPTGSGGTTRVGSGFFSKLFGFSTTKTPSS